MMADYQPKNKADLLEVIRRERATLEFQIKNVNDEQMAESGVEAQWSIKDLLVHIAAWERLAQDRIHAAITGEPTKIPLIAGEDFVDVFNAEVYQTHKDDSLRDVLIESKASYNDFIRQIESLEEDILSKTMPFDWAGDLTFQVLISANSHWHYIEHARSIQKWLETKNI